jgi:ligand-binding SRPBCC domain-containing protein
MACFTRSRIIDAPVEIVFGYHERPDALQLLAPRFPPVQILKKTGGIEAGSRVELKVGMLHWVAVHTRYHKNRLFVDEQVEGPFALWVHRHEFQSLGDKSRLTDCVTYTLPGGGWINAMFGWLVKLGLRPTDTESPSDSAKKSGTDVSRSSP